MARLLLIGATGLVGGALLDRLADAPAGSVAALARRAMPPRDGIEALVADPMEWPAIIERWRPELLVSTLGTTWRAAGRDEQAFRAVDQHLVVDAARAARGAGARQAILMSSVGASVRARSFYLRVKGETEQAVSGLGFERVDLLRPGLLRGARGGPTRRGESLAAIASPLTDALASLAGQRRYRSIVASDVAAAIAALAADPALPPGRVVHEHDALMALARG